MFGFMYLRIDINDCEWKRGRLYFKIGTTICIVCRHRGFKTNHRVIDRSRFLLILIPIISSPIDLYAIDSVLLAESSRRHRQPYLKDDENNGGDEFYEMQIENLEWPVKDPLNLVQPLIDWLKRVGIEVGDPSVLDIAEMMMIGCEHQESVDHPRTTVPDPSLIDRLLRSWVEEEVPQIEPHRWQKELDQRYVRLLDRKEYAGVVVAPTGSGKTVAEMMMMIRHLNNGDSVMLITKRRDLFDQLIGEMTHLLRLFRSDARVVNLRVRVDKSRVAIEPNTLYLVNIDQLSKFELIDGNRLTLIIHDESHWAGGQITAEQLIKLRPNRHLIGFSATPIRATVANYQNTVRVYGDGKQIELLYHLGYQRAIEDGIIAKFKIKPLLFEREQLDESDEFEDGRRVYYLSRIGCRRLAEDMRGMMEVCREAGEPELALVYCRNRRDVREMTSVFVGETLMDGFEIRCSYAEIGEEDREFARRVGLDPQKISSQAYIDEFKGSKKMIMFTIMRCAEGFNLPELKCVYRGYVSQSFTAHLEMQRVGRVTRRCRGRVGSYRMVMFDEEDDGIARQMSMMMRDIALYIEGLSKLESRCAVTREVEQQQLCRKVFDEYFDFDTSTTEWTYDYIYQLTATDPRVRLKAEYEIVQTEVIAEKFTCVDQYKEQADRRSWPPDPETHFEEIGKFSWLDLLGLDRSRFVEFRVAKKLLRKQFSKKVSADDKAKAKDRLARDLIGGLIFPDRYLWDPVYGKRFVYK